MSRCFPFPPPGYEKKLNIDANLLAKAKQNDKKHKKDKNDKEKKEVKEKDKDRSKEKLKEKKERHRDKSLERNNLSDEKKIEGPGESILQSNHFAEASYLQELAKRIKDDDSATGSKTVQRYTHTHQKQVGSSGSVAAKLDYRSERKEKSKDKNTSKKIAHEQRGNYETGVRKVAVVRSFSWKEQKRVDMVKSKEKDVNKAVEKKEKERPHGSGSNGDTNKVKDEKGFKRQVELSNGKNFGSDRLQHAQFLQNGFVQEFGREVRREHASPKSQFAEKNIWTDQKRSGCMGETTIGANPKREISVGRIVVANISYCSDGKNDGNGFYVQTNRHCDKARGTKISFVHNLSQTGQRRVVGFDSMEKGIKRTADGKEKSKLVEPDSTADRGLDRKQTPKFGDRIVERTRRQTRQGGEPNEKVLKIKELKIKEVIREIEDDSKSCISTYSNRISAPEGSAKKMKQPELNGFLIDNDIRPNKLQGPPASCHPPTENGRKLHEASIFPHSAPKEKGTAINHKLQEKDPTLNGIADPWQPTLNLAISPSRGHRSSASSIISQSAFKEKGTAINHELEGETKISGFLDQSQSTINSSMSSSTAPKAKSHKTPYWKPPHPETKYLSQILSVDFAELDTQDWLFDSDSFSLKKPESCASGAETQQQVWDEALHIQSADISALPYVIPY